MRVLFIAPLPDPVTGQSLACQVLLDGLKAAGHAVDTININKASLKSGDGSWARIQDVMRYAWRARRLAPRADLIYFTISESIAGNLKDLLIYLACFPRLKRMVIHLHGGAGMRVLMHDRPRLSAANRFFLQRLGGIVLLGARHLDILRDLSSQAHIHLVPNFAQDEYFLDEADIQRKFLTRRPLKLLYLSNLISGKGYLELMAAYEALDPNEQQQLQLDFAGAFETPTDEATFMQRLARLPSAHYHGVVGGRLKAQLLASAHVFCLPTYYPYEGQPISILEAFASGCAVITTDHSGIFDVFDPARAGLAVKKRSVPSLTEALRRCLNEPDLLRAAGLHNRREADLHYRVATYNRRLVSLLEERAAAASAH
jgi:glycosyltransferase involved in cell wall biosynthesis